MSRKTADAEAPAADIEAPAAEPVTAPEQLPQKGGCFIRNPDGTLTRDPAFHGEQEG